MENRDKKKYKHKGLRETSVNAVIGEIKYKRVMYEIIAQIFENEKDGYYIYMNPNWTKSPEFKKVFLNLENAIALDYHPNLTKAELLSYIQTEEMREKYMKSPSRELLLDIFRSQVDDKRITQAGVLKSALKKVLQQKKTVEAATIENLELNPQKINEGETKDSE